MIDSAYLPLLPYLQTTPTPTLWLADESALSALQTIDITSNCNLHIVTNRYDVYEAALSKNISAEFNDFTLNALPFIPHCIIYRVSKEKALTHYLFNQAAHLLDKHTNGEFIIAGKKQEGIKTYSEKLNKIFKAKGKIKKIGNDYLGVFTQLDAQKKIDDQDYNQVRPIEANHIHHPFFYSKPGVFGWNKIDKGSELLLETLPSILEKYEKKPKSILDLGCGYGWLFMNIHHAIIKHIEQDTVTITATDNNASAIRCALKNAESCPTFVEVIADNCAKKINKKFDLIVCNPPFHQGFSHSKALTELFLTQTHKHLSPHGIAVFVVNEFIKLSHLSNTASGNAFSECEIITQKGGFKIIALKV